MAATTSNFASHKSDNVYVKAALNFVDAINEGFESGPGEYKRIRDCFLESGTVSIVPSSMIQPGDKNSITREEQLQKLDGFKQMIPKTNIKVHDFIQQDTRVWVKARADGKSASGQPYTNDYLFFYTFVNVDKASPGETTTVDGQGDEAKAGLPKLVEMKEFFDSAYLQGFIGKEQQALQKGGS